MKYSSRHCKFIAILIFTLSTTYAASIAQNVKGRILGVSEEPGADKELLDYASVYWAGTNIGTMSDENGEFSIGRAKGYNLLVAAHMGYVSDTMDISSANLSAIEFILYPNREALDEFVVYGAQRGNYNKLDGMMKSEVITFAGLTKMACCSLAESFENSASVTVGYSDAITGTRQIRMLGLAGIYTQMLDETRPIMRGLSAPYGLTYTPGMWLQGIQVSKGVASVTGGHEAITGQINLEYRKPTDDVPLFVNTYIDNDLRTEINVASSLRVTDKLSTVILGHGSIDTKRADHNGDGFLDMPLTRQANVANRWLYAASNGVQVRTGFKFVAEDRIGGVKDFRPDRDGRPSSVADPYGSKIDNRYFNAYLKVAMPLGRYVYDESDESVERSNLAIIADYAYFDTDSYFGMLKDYRGTQNSGHLNAMYSWTISPAHKLVSGISATVDNFDERLRDGTINASGEITGNFETPFNRTEKTAGAYTEYTFEPNSTVSVVGGIRGDFNNLHGWFATPRAHIRLAILPKLIFRGSAGLGYRSANLFTDNLWMFGTGRTLLFRNGSLENTDMQERSFTYGGSLSWYFKMLNDDNASLSFDFYRSNFSNYVVADQEFDTNHIAVYNVRNNGAHSTTYQVDFNVMPVRNFDVVLTFRYNESKITLDRPDGTTMVVDRPLTDNFKGLINLQYATRYRRWVFDFTAQLNGRSRLPAIKGESPLETSYSQVYPMFYAQVTFKLNNMATFYIGCENIGDFTQHHVIHGGDAPYTTAFNSSVVWGPLMGRKIYLGTRFNF